jgi:hypothetical protein
MTEREDRLASIASTIRDYRAGEISEPTPEHVDRWIRQFGDDVQTPMLRELDYVFKRTYVSRNKAQQLFAKIAGSFSSDFWSTAHILDIQQNGSSQAEMRELLMRILHQRYSIDVSHAGSTDGAFIYLDDAIFTGQRVIDDLSYWMLNHAPGSGTLRIMVIALHEGGRYWIEQNQSQFKSEKQITVHFHRFDGFAFENRRTYRHRSNVLWPTADVHNAQGFEPRNPGGTVEPPFASEQGRQLLEREFLSAGVKIQGFAANPSQRLKPLGFSNFHPGFGSLFVTYRNCPNNCPLALWYGDPTYGANHPLGRWYPLFPRKTYNP